MAKVHIFGGGTVFHVRPHTAICAPAYGATARALAEIVRECTSFGRPHVHLTKMAGGPYLETNADVARRLDEVVADPETRVVFMSAAMCDWEARFVRDWREVNRVDEDAGKDRPRLRTQDGDIVIGLTPAEKVIRRVRRERKDIFLVGFKSTAGDSDDLMFHEGLRLLKGASCNLVLVNDIRRRWNMIVTPEQARYCATGDRERVLRELVAMTEARSRLRFTRSTVVEGPRVPWDEVNPVLRGVVEHLITRGAYHGIVDHRSVGHFAQKVGEGEFLTSIRGADYNIIRAEGMCRVTARGDGEVVAVGAKPSVGGQSQRAIFRAVPEADSIAHAHVQLRPGSHVPVRSQREFECGSHECGENTVAGLLRFGYIWAVMLDRHGPNVVFDSKKVTAKEVIAFMEENFYLDRSTSALE